jgi:hypothetical protein
MIQVSENVNLSDVLEPTNQDIDDAISKLEGMWGYAYKLQVRPGVCRLIKEICDREQITKKRLFEAIDSLIVEYKDEDFMPRPKAIVAKLMGSYNDLDVMHQRWELANGCGECYDGFRVYYLYDRDGHYQNQYVFWCNCPKATMHPSYNRIQLDRWTKIQEYIRRGDNIHIITQDNHEDEYMKKYDMITEEIPF